MSIQNQRRKRIKMEFYKLKKIFTSWRVLLLLGLLLASFVIINPAFDDRGVAIRSVAINSSASLAGISGPSPSSLPRQREILYSINNNPINSISDYYDVISTIPPNITVIAETSEGTYRILSKPLINTTIVGYEFEDVETIINETTNETVVERIEVPVIDGTVLGTQDLGLGVYDAPASNLRLGLDLEGGTRVLLEPEDEVTEDDTGVLIENLKQRLNVYGLSDISVKSASDLTGQSFILVEIPGANQEEVRDLIARQGKFEAKIGNESVFLGGDDITHVCRTAECSGIDPNSGCGTLADGSWTCRFRFSISLSTTAAERQASITEGLEVIVENNDEYLSQDLDLFLDDALVDSLKISADLRGQASTDIAISGGGNGPTRAEAQVDALKNMKKLQTVLITGSLPVKLNVVKTDSISPVLGDEFINNILFIGLLAIVAVLAVVFIKYRKLSIVLPMAVNMFSEVILLLGFGALAGWSLDLAAIAGIIIAIGTGIDHQIVITDEILRGEALSGNYSWAQKMKRAFSIILVAYFTTVAAMFFLLTAGAGLLKGFALTTIMGVTIGVLISRPAYAAIIEILLKE
jgi:preprotein translocase subunit SecD